MNTIHISKLNPILIAPPKVVMKTGMTAASRETLSLEEAVNSVIILGTSADGAEVNMPTGDVGEYLGPDRDPEGHPNFWTRFLCSTGAPTSATTELDITLKASSVFATGADIVFKAAGDYAEFFFRYDKDTNSLSAIRYRVSVTT